MKNLKLAPKFTLILSGLFVCAIIISGVALSQVTQQRAEADVTYRAQMLMELMSSVRTYTSKEISPLLAQKLETETEFIPQVIPTYSAREIFEAIRQQPNYRDYRYKDAVLNPTNPKDKADEFEAKLVERFRSDPNLDSITGFRSDLDKELFFNARPIVITDRTCLRCHSTLEAAPKSLLASYGSENGFNWPLDKVLGAQTVYIPSQDVFDIAHQLSTVAISIFIVTFALVILLINFLLKRAVIQPIRPMARLARKISNDEISADQTTEPDMEALSRIARNGDELGQLARVFQQMANAIYVRKQSFNQQLEQLSLKSEATKVYTPGKSNKIAYFKALQQKAEAIRKRLAESSKPT
ncbi:MULTISPECIES: c-type heme family protein [unclassified Coleofasciculus]|uniref:c-type heme family protein n=1 Tax=unclassified Coleofasciculus TaxID=2692782 RepID=UPI00187F3DCF|nr:MULTISPECIES: DUF3365 domain-containing protein [unclassified Coleofasciculus]MBE9126971.1 DUF3365 domain-containing protein [Coleofasciculus sp. LEGE 07081]MBE9150346.1 DUF3365 domain-containing protein [Coleofasciculus sp. LEGE 07092]